MSFVAEVIPPACWIIFYFQYNNFYSTVNEGGHELTCMTGIKNESANEVTIKALPVNKVFFYLCVELKKLIMNSLTHLDLRYE